MAHKKPLIYAMAALLALTGTLPAHADSTNGLPRWVSIKSEQANVRMGPGSDYQIKWVVVRPGIPVEVVAEFEPWRKIRDIDGEEGWVHKIMLSTTRHVIVTQDQEKMRENEQANAPVIAILERGVEAELETCKGDVCLLKHDQLEGWVARKSLWGIYPEEVIE